MSEIDAPDDVVDVTSAPRLPSPDDSSTPVQAPRPIDAGEMLTDADPTPTDHGALRPDTDTLNALAARDDDDAESDTPPRLPDSARIGPDDPTPPYGIPVTVPMLPPTVNATAAETARPSRWDVVPADAAPADVTDMPQSSAEWLAGSKPAAPRFGVNKPLFSKATTRKRFAYYMLALIVVAIGGWFAIQAIDRSTQSATRSPTDSAEAAAAREAAERERCTDLRGQIEDAITLWETTDGAVDDVETLVSASVNVRPDDWEIVRVDGSTHVNPTPGSSCDGFIDPVE